MPVGGGVRAHGATGRRSVDIEQPLPTSPRWDRFSFASHRDDVRGDTLRIHTLPLAAPVLAGLLAAATACGGSSSASDDGSSGSGGKTLKVVATTTQVADFARNVGGDKVKVSQILKPNVDPHDYE